MRIKSAENSSVKEGTKGIATYAYSSVVYLGNSELTEFTVYWFDVAWDGGGKGKYQLGRDIVPIKEDEP